MRTSCKSSVRTATIGIREGLILATDLETVPDTESPTDLTELETELLADLTEPETELPADLTELPTDFTDLLAIFVGL